MVKVSLVAENDGIVAGRPFIVGLRQEITPEWHTYWINSGDTGLATTIKWNLPEGFSASELVFPTPHKQPMGSLMNYGYSDQVMALATLSAPENLRTGETVMLNGKVSLLVCKEICIPETHEVSLELPVVEDASSGPWASAFTATRAKLPQAHKSIQRVEVSDGNLIVSISPIPIPDDEIPEEVYFYPHNGLLIEHPAEQELTLTGRDAMLTIPLNKARSTPIEKVTGDLWFRNAMGERSYVFEATVETPPALVTAPPVKKKPADTPGKSRGGESVTLLTAVLSAFVAGIILNLMPCVFPVLSLKALGLVQKSQKESHREVVIGGLFYLAGVLATFTLLGAALIGLKAAGHQVGWGVQLQSPEFVAAVALLLFFIGLVLIGAVTFGGNFIGAGDKLANKSGHAGSFFTGALAVVVATPCTAPFMGAAIFYGLTQAAPVTLTVLWALGFGLALPYLLLTWFPNLLLKHLPKPGLWMEHFKQFLAFPMWAAAVWLVWVLAQQTGATGVLHLMIGMLCLGFGFWLWGTARNKTGAWTATKKILAVVIVIMGLVYSFRQPMMVETAAKVAAGANYEAYSPERLEQLRAEGKPVFVNMTAAWCITCLANEKATLATQKVRDAFAEKGIVYLKGDWTNFDDAITDYLKSFGRSGVPIYVYYPAEGGEPVLLPQILTPDLVITTLNQPPQGELP